MDRVERMQIEALVDSLSATAKKFDKYEDEGYKESFATLAKAIRMSVSSMRTVLERTYTDYKEQDDRMKRSVGERARELAWFLENLE